MADLPEDPKEIWLEPGCGEDGGEGRLWCDHDAWGACEDCDASAVRYIRADLARPAPRNDDAEALAEALRDMLAGWKYIREHHGDLYGVGWDRAQDAAEAALSDYTGGLILSAPALTDPSEGEGWRDIATAPRDGTAIQARIPGHGSDNVIAWTDSLLDDKGDDCGGWHFADEQEPPACWTDGVCWELNGEGEKSVQPTHWKPLAPASEGAA